MPEKMRALFRGATDANGVPQEWLGPEPGMSAVEMSDGTIVAEAIPEAPAVPARHLTDDEYDALSPRNKERVKHATTSDGKPLYEVRSQKEMTPASKAAVHKEGE